MSKLMHRNPAAIKSRINERKKTTPNSSLDNWLARASNISQPLLFLLAAFGYFYTVQPIYQKELLSEQISEKEIELKALRGEILETKPKINDLHSELEALKSYREKEKIKTEIEIHALQKKKIDLESTNKLLTKKNLDTEAALHKTYLSIYHENFGGRVFIQYILFNQKNNEVSQEKSLKEYISNHLLTAYDAIQTVLLEDDYDFIEAAQPVPQNIRNQYRQVVSKYIHKNKSRLSEPLSNIDDAISRIENQKIRKGIEIQNNNIDTDELQNKIYIRQTIYEMQKIEMDRTINTLKEIGEELKI